MAASMKVMSMSIKQEGYWVWSEEEQEPMSNDPTISSSSSSVTANNSVEDNDITSEATRCSEEIAKLNEQLALAQATIAEEREQRLEAEEKFEKLENSVEIGRQSVDSKASTVSEKISLPPKRPAPPTPLEELNDINYVSEEGPRVAKSSKSSDPTKIAKLTRETVSIPGRKHGMDITKRHQGFFCICGIKFISRESLDGHLKFQNKDTQSRSHPVSKHDIEHKVIPSKPLQCVCGFRSTCKRYTSHHVMYYNAEKKFVCDLCPKQFLNNGYLKAHYARSHKVCKGNTLGIGCRKCGISFETVQKFQQHSKAVHSNAAVQSSSPPVRPAQPTQPEDSDDCIEIIDEGSEESGNRPSKQLTPRQLVSKSNEAHTSTKRLNNAKKRFGCVICNEAFPRSHHLHSHLKDIHSAEDPTKLPILCPICGVTFRKIQNFIRHRVTVHSTKRKVKAEGKREDKLALSSGNSVPIPIIDLDDDDDDDGEYSSSPLLSEPTLILIDVDDDEDKMAVSKLKSQRTRRVNGELWCKKCRQNFKTQESFLVHNKGFHKLSTEAAE